jgi:hypothetical protein
MRVVLRRRGQDGVHHFMKECEVPGPVSRYAHYVFDDRRGNFQPHVREDKLLKALPSGFLLTNHQQILLLVETPPRAKNAWMYDNAVELPRRFASWAKYFSTYSLTLERGA